MRYGNLQSPKRNCRKEKGFFVVAFFQASYLTLKQIFQFSYFNFLIFRIIPPPFPVPRLYSFSDDGISPKLSIQL